MALAFTSKDRGGAASTSLTQVTASIAPTAGSLLLACATRAKGTGAPTALASVTDGGIGKTTGWTQIASLAYDTSGTSTGRIDVWACIVSGTPGSGTITFTASE